MRLKPTLQLEVAASIIDEALRLGRQERMHPLTIVVLDAGGRIVAAKSEDGSGILRFGVAQGKAWGALGMGISSRLIRDRLGNRPSFQNALAVASDKSRRNPTWIANARAVPTATSTPSRASGDKSLSARVPKPAAVVSAVRAHARKVGFRRRPAQPSLLNTRPK